MCTVITTASRYSRRVFLFSLILILFVSRLFLYVPFVCLFLLQLPFDTEIAVRSNVTPRFSHSFTPQCVDLLRKVFLVIFALAPFSLSSFSSLAYHFLPINFLFLSFFHISLACLVFHSLYSLFVCEFHGPIDYIACLLTQPIDCRLCFLTRLAVDDI